MNTFKTLTLMTALATCAFAAPAFAIKTCNLDGSCQSPNGPSLDGLVEQVRSEAQPLSIKVCNTDGSCQSPNGPSLDGWIQEQRSDAQPLSIKVCNSDSSCSSPNGPSASGRADARLGTVIIAITMP